jgi:hypothetical protein
MVAAEFLIKEYYGYHEFGDFPWSFRLKRLPYTRAWSRSDVLFSLRVTASE